LSETIDIKIKTLWVSYLPVVKIIK
jgi:hypothetical protein